MKEAIDPIHALTVFMLSACVFFSKTCIEVSWPWPARYIVKPLKDPADAISTATGTCGNPAAPTFGDLL
ncbi:hypothetical protein C8F01DRAFT_1248333 [Mycena amicta]|nr:hypothetical protein C8F01DRAFT_1248333 [Mycena amicta]